MSSFGDFREKALGLRNKGLTAKEIADELNLQIDTVTWLLLHEKERRRTPTPFDFSVNWSAIGSSPKRLGLIGSTLADLAAEAVETGEFESFDVVVGVELSGSPLALVIADKLGKPYASARAARAAPSGEEGKESTVGTLSANFSSVASRKVLLVTDVISTGVILNDIVKSLKENKAKPVGMVAFVDKRAGGDVGGVPVRSLVNLISIKR